MYDLKLWPIRTRRGQPLHEAEGFLAAAPPRRAVRSRSEDLLILSLSTRGSRQPAEDTQKAWLEHLAQVFFKTSGSVTSAMRSLVESLNLTMMDNNLQTIQEGGPVTGVINVATIHRGALYLVQCGVTHAYTLTQAGLHHFTDIDHADHGMGLSRTPQVRYYQVDLGDEGYFFTADTHTNSWTEEFLLLDGFPNQELLRRRLLHQVKPNFRLDLVHIFPGEGQINTAFPAVHAPEQLQEVRSEESAEADAVKESITAPSVEAPEVTFEEETDAIQIADDSVQEEEVVLEDLEETPVESLTSQAEGDQTQDSPSSPVEAAQSPLPTSERTPSEAFGMAGASSSNSTDQAPSDEKTPSRRTKVPVSEKIKRIKSRTLGGLDAGFDGWQRFRGKFNQFFKDLLARLTPGDDVPRLSRGTLLMIAVIVPIIVVGIAVGVYLARGRTLQYEQYFSQAQAASQLAAAAEDPDTARAQWAQALAFLDQAEAFRSTTDTTALRAEAQDALDVLDGAVRLDYRPAISGELYSEINITGIISYGLDLYLFDSAGGRVIHATGGSQGYEIDPDFVCSAGNYSGGGVDSLVDMAVLPINNTYQAHLLAVDSMGNVVYCAPGQSPVVQSLPGMGTSGLNIQKIAYANNSLYVLDQASMMVLVYPATNGQFLDVPVNFFAEAQVDELPDMARVIDLAVNGSELYLLNNNGEMVNCTYTGLPGDPLNCANPVTYADGRPGKEEQQVTMPEGDYTSIQYITPPDPSICILDGSTADIYQFSLRFRLYQRLRPDLGDYEIDSPTATAFTVGIDQIAFIAFGNQVFYAYVE